MGDLASTQLWLPAATYDGQALQVSNTGDKVIATWVVRGLYDTWEVRGDDSVLPTAHGRTARDRKRDYLVIELDGFVMGYGATTALQRSNMHTQMQLLKTTFDPTKDPQNLVVDLPDGVTSGTISCRPLNLVWPRLQDASLDPIYQPFSVELYAVGTDWVFA